MWYGVFLWALVSSLFFHVPAGLLALCTLRHQKYGATIAGVYRAAGKEMIPFEALTLGTGQTFCVVVVFFLWVLATLEDTPSNYDAEPKFCRILQKNTLWNVVFS
ncbi:transmembrane protein 170A-like [Diceros bicornis minor]|uniref:transmembrane protein 170A-like n=1 Tax=Diceros bicornis minor TaxID=77932 RepID=UPI0026F1037D|nr:transmembrane protein 170A-like [Diceros bicornis minor]